MITETFSSRPRRRNPLLLPVRLLLYWLVKVVVLLFLGIRLLLRPRIVRYGLLALLVAGGVAWKALGGPTLLAGPAGSPGRETLSITVADQLPQPAVVERYLKAQAEFDAKAMWDTMADRLKIRMMATNNSQEQLQKELDTARQQQRRYSSAVYVGGLELDGGKSAYFYVLTMESAGGSSRLPYTFVVDQEGKITNIQWSLDR